jgi:hypothetical protein
MKISWLRSNVAAVLALAPAFALLLLAPAPVSAQFAAQPKPEDVAKLQAKPTPRTAEGHPDLTGYWSAPIPVGSGETKVSADGKSIELQIAPPSVLIAQRNQGAGRGGAEAGGGGGGRGGRGGAANPPPYKPELLAKVKSLHDVMTDTDPEYRCMPDGVPRSGPPTEIFQSAGAVVFLYESRNLARVIPTDGRPHDATLEPSWMGDGVAHWDGDTLVVDSVNFTDESWLGPGGYFHSDAMHVTERLTRQGDTLRYDVTVEDPTVFTKPWVMNPRTIVLNEKGEHMTEDAPCVEHDQGHLVEKAHQNP